MHHAEVSSALVRITLNGKLDLNKLHAGLLSKRILPLKDRVSTDHPQRICIGVHLRGGLGWLQNYCGCDIKGKTTINPV